MADKDYKWIRAWGVLLGSFSYYVNEQIDKARKQDAPETAVYMKTKPGGNDDRWVTKEECHSNAQRQLEEIVASKGW